jgi:hypothetical protein
MNSRILIAAIAVVSFPFLTAPASASKYHHHRQIHHHYRHIDRLPTSQAYSAAQSCVSDNNGHQLCQGVSERTETPLAKPPHKSIRTATNKEHKGNGSIAEFGTAIIGGRPPGCPHAYCGCEASRYLFGRIIPELNRAAAWFKFPHASPAPNMVAVRNHHVFVILSVNSDGSVLAHDGNSGHGLIREHIVSLRGYSVRDPHGARVASL